MAVQLPLRVTEKEFARALAAFRSVVGAEWVLATDEDRATYRDIYRPANETRHVPSAAVVPQSAEQVQAILRLANEFKTPVWPISRGKNMGYGGTAPVQSGSIVLDLSRMKRILEVDEKRGYCVIEPGVGFFDLYQHLQTNKTKLWMSPAANAWGSVIGNALDRGVGYTPYGENTSQLCGLEVAMPSGELVRTGMGAMTDAKAAHLFKFGFGPSLDQLFVQSNFGVVTKAGMWLMPEPEATRSLAFSLPEADDIVAALDVLAQLRLRKVIDSNVTIGNYMRVVTMDSQRSQWYQGEGPLPDSVVQEIKRKYNTGWWNFTINLFGYEEVIEANARIIKNAFANKVKFDLKESRWNHIDPPLTSGIHIPTTIFLQVVNWWGGRGGHMGFSPILPQDGKVAFAQFDSTRKRYEAFGLDHYGGFTMGERYLTNVNQIIYDRDNEDQTGRAHKLFDTLIRDAAAAGFGEYRTHLSYMDKVAATFDFNNHSLWRVHEKIKDALDPNGIVAPGKSGIWPKAYRQGKA
jgi:4-cresol dehydrogenase (hydroxylating) flavoprotein subunit